MKIATESVDMPRQLPVWGAVAATPPKATGRQAWKRGGATLLALVVSGAGLWWLVSDPVVVAFTAALHRARIWDLAAAWALFPIIQWLRAWRFSLLITGRVEGSSWRMFAITSRLLLFNYLLPFKLGEISFPLMAQRTFGIDFLRATGVLIVVRVMDLCVVSTLLAFGVVLLADGEAHSWWQSPLLTGTGVVVSVLLVVGPELLAPNSAQQSSPATQDAVGRPSGLAGRQLPSDLATPTGACADAGHLVRPVVARLFRGESNHD